MVSPSSKPSTQQSSTVTATTPTATVGTTTAKRSNSRHTQLCTVCGDRAYYVFYGAVACDSCR